MSRLKASHALALGGSLLATSVGIGCWQSATAPRTCYLYVKDFSGSAIDESRRFDGEMALDLESAPPNSSVVVLRMGRKSEEVFSGDLDGASLDSAVRALKEGSDTPDPKERTDFSAMAEALARATERERCDVLRVRVLTDGGDDYAGDAARQRRYGEAVKALCADPRLESVVFMGVRPEFRERLRERWSKAGTRLSIRTLEQRE